MNLHHLQEWTFFAVYMGLLFKTSSTVEDLSRQEDMIIKEILQSCSIRFSMIEEVRSRIPCSKVKNLNPICENNITVTFSHMPPYVHNKSGHVVGILPGKISFP